MADSDPGNYLRFERRAGAYAASRPDYPAKLVQFLLHRLALPAGAAVADIGSGTGIFSRLLLGSGLHVSAIEPSGDMRMTAEAELREHLGFSSIHGTAQATGLSTGSVAAIFCAQAFHWFNEAATLREWRRILKPGGTTALIWNYHDETDPFVAAYLEVVRAFGTDADKTMASAWNTHRDNVLFRDRAAEVVSFPHTQQLDFDGLLRRAASTSYLPKNGDPRFAAMATRLQAAFDRYQSTGTVTLVYRTIAVFGPLD